ncbi:MAG: NADH-quinone oxidoreductase subunit J [Phycisphaeraceae bacterium]|nr:NADH-quinone oxidoreductase subunit J [Phycisphaeraceae bacterium]
MGEIIHPFLLYAGIAVGGIGVAASLPRRRVSPQLLGGLLGAIGLGMVLLGFTLRAADRTPDQMPSIYFYVFALIALGAGLRVITNRRPVYAALYFILTILASAGMYILLSATFMAFALIIVYAGAILITYLFVIMLATQAPSEEETDSLTPYDAEAREPFFAAATGFALLAVLSTMVVSGVRGLPRDGIATPPANELASLPRRVERALRAAGTIEPEEQLVIGSSGLALVDAQARTARVGIPADGSFTSIRDVGLPEDLAVRNVESLAFDFLNRHPGTIEIAGVILLMAMLGAVVLSRRQVELDEELKRQQARPLGSEEMA